MVCRVVGRAAQEMPLATGAVAMGRVVLSASRLERLVGRTMMLGDVVGDIGVVVMLIEVVLGRVVEGSKLSVEGCGEPSEIMLVSGFTGRILASGNALSAAGISASGMDG
jgi:hypothetical protein